MPSLLLRSPYPQVEQSSAITAAHYGPSDSTSHAAYSLHTTGRLQHQRQPEPDHMPPFPPPLLPTAMLKDTHDLSSTRRPLQDRDSMSLTQAQPSTQLQAPTIAGPLHTSDSPGAEVQDTLDSAQPSSEDIQMDDHSSLESTHRDSGTAPISEITTPGAELLDVNEDTANEDVTMSPPRSQTPEPRRASPELPAPAQIKSEPEDRKPDVEWYQWN